MPAQFMSQNVRWARCNNNESKGFRKLSRVIQFLFLWIIVTTVTFSLQYDVTAS